MKLYLVIFMVSVMWGFASLQPLEVRPETLVRLRRFTDRNQYNGPNNPQQKKPEWEVKPELSRDQRGNTKGQVTVENHGPNHDVEAGWGQNLGGPDKHSGTWHVGGNVRW
ncbi:hypothetical protein D910_04599 [Dendroctonus ponderosae]